MKVAHLTVRTVRRAYAQTGLLPCSEPWYVPERHLACPLVVLAMADLGGEAAFQAELQKAPVRQDRSEPLHVIARVRHLLPLSAEAFKDGVIGRPSRHWEAPGHNRAATRWQCQLCAAWRAGGCIRRAYGWSDQPDRPLG